MHYRIFNHIPSDTPICFAARREMCLWHLIPNNNPSMHLGYYNICNHNPSETIKEISGIYEQMAIYVLPYRIPYIHICDAVFFPLYPSASSIPRPLIIIIIFSVTLSSSIYFFIFIISISDYPGWVLRFKTPLWVLPSLVLPPGDTPPPIQISIAFHLCMKKISMTNLRPYWDYHRTIPTVIIPP